MTAQENALKRFSLAHYGLVLAAMISLSYSELAYAQAQTPDYSHQTPPTIVQSNANGLSTQNSSRAQSPIDPASIPANIFNPTGSSNTSKFSATSTPLVKKPILQGGINHAEELPALEDTLRPGRVFSDDLLIKAGTETSDLWFYIPAWFAGTRHSEECLVMYRYDYKTGQTTTPMQWQLNRQDSTSGYLQDRNGGIWDYHALPSIHHVESDLVNAILYVKKITPVMGNQDKLVIKYEELSVSVNKRTNKILQVLQQEQINTITSPTPGELKIEISVKCFDFDGNPLRLEQSDMTLKMTKPFVRKDTYNGTDLKRSFRDYLISHNMENLVPKDMTGTP